MDPTEGYNNKIKVLKRVSYGIKTIIDSPSPTIDTEPELAKTESNRKQLDHLSDSAFIYIKLLEKGTIS